MEIVRRRRFSIRNGVHLGIPDCAGAFPDNNNAVRNDGRGSVWIQGLSGSGRWSETAKAHFDGE